MRKQAMSRRILLNAGACALVATVVIPKSGRAHAATGLSQQNEQISSTSICSRSWDAITMRL